jgi:hypothetical protein
VSETSVLTDLLVTEHAAVYAYGVVGAHLDEATRRVAVAAFDAHRARRDELLTQLRSRGLPTPGPELSYDVAVANRAQALTMAVRIETELGVRWRDLVAVTDDIALRRLAVPALQDSAVRASRWRTTAHLAPATVALPGEA